MPCFVCVLLLGCFFLQQRKRAPLRAAPYLLSALPINMTGNNPFNKFLLFFPGSRKNVGNILEESRAEGFLITLNFLRPELHHEEHLLKSGLRGGDNSVGFFQLRSHTAKTAADGVNHKR